MSVKFIEIEAAIFSDDPPKLALVRKKIRELIKELECEAASLHVSGPYEVEV